MSLSKLELRVIAVTLCAAMGYAAFVGIFRIDLPGLSYDEVLYLPASFTTLGDCSTAAGVSSQLGRCFPLFLGPLYLGALKAYLYAPLVAIFPVSPGLIRLPSMVLAISIAVLSYVFFRHRIGRLAALFAAVLLLTSPVYLWHSRIDFGPFVIGAGLRFTVLAFMFRWVETQRPIQLALAGAAFAIGLYDKLNFVWLLLPLFAAFLLCYPREIITAIKQKPVATAAIALTCSAIGLFFLFDRIIPATHLHLYPHEQTTIDNAWRVVELLSSSFSGAAQARSMFAAPNRISSVLSIIFFGQLVFGCVVMALALILPRQHALTATQSAQLRLFSTLHIVLIGSTITLVMSYDVVGTHHAVFLLPLTAYQAASMFVAIKMMTVIWVPRARIFVTSFLSILALGIVIGQINVGLIYLDLLKRDPLSYTRGFTPEIYRLSNEIEDLGIDSVISVDWGTQTQLVSLAAPEHRNYYREQWGEFASSDPIAAQSNLISKLVPEGKTVVFVTKPQDLAFMKKATANFRSALDVLPDCMSITEAHDAPAQFLLVIVKDGCS